jgi:hypothetical protein
MITPLTGNLAEYVAEHLGIAYQLAFQVPSTTPVRRLLGSKTYVCELHNYLKVLVAVLIPEIDPFNLFLGAWEQSRQFVFLWRFKFFRIRQNKVSFMECFHPCFLSIPKVPHTIWIQILDTLINYAPELEFIIHSWCQSHVPEGKGQLQHELQLKLRYLPTEQFSMAKDVAEDDQQLQEACCRFVVCRKASSLLQIDWPGAAHCCRQTLRSLPFVEGTWLVGTTVNKDTS